MSISTSKSPRPRYEWRLFSSLLICCIMATVTGCTLLEVPPSTQADEPESTEVTAQDPFAYCAEQGDVDSPDESLGSDVSDAIFDTMVKQELITADVPQESIFWRCMEGEVWGCFVGANLPCWAKADTSETPTEGMKEYCQEQVDGFIPAFATGRETVYEWECQDGEPTIVKQLVEVDPRGYPSLIWHKLSPQE